MVQIKKLAKVKSAKLALKNKNLKESMAKFSKSLKKEDLDKFLEQKTDLMENDHVPKD